MKVYIPPTYQDEYRRREELRQFEEFVSLLRYLTPRQVRALVWRARWLKLKCRVRLFWENWV